MKFLPYGSLIPLVFVGQVHPEILRGSPLIKSVYARYYYYRPLTQLHVLLAANVVFTTPALLPVMELPANT